jgi:3-hydroxybutyryl-CoA dehydrogenase
MEATHITVVGAGTMGSGIAQVCAASGFDVTLIDTDPAALERGRAAIEGRWARDVERGRLDAAARQAALGRLGTATAIDAARGELVIEAIVEDLAAKCGLFAALDGSCPPETLLASNTSSLSITRLGAATRRPQQVVGLHFFNPVPVMRLVEIVPGLATAAATVTAATVLAERLGKVPVMVQDSPGFVANRILMPLLNEAVFLLMEGVASREAIDSTATLGLNHPMGPLTLADHIGLDVCLAVLEVLHHDLGDDKYRPCPLLRRMVAAGYLGRKTGRGFYEYDAR